MTLLVRGPVLRSFSHQEDDTLLGVTWRDLPQLGVFGRIGHLGKYTKTRQLSQLLMLFAMCLQIICQVCANSNAKSATLTHLSVHLRL